jgi:hypothetical protein
MIRDFTLYADLELIKHNTTLKTKIKKNPYYESIFIYHYKYDLETYPHINIKKCIYNTRLYSYISMFIYILKYKLNKIYILKLNNNEYSNYNNIWLQIIFVINYKDNNSDNLLLYT